MSQKWYQKASVQSAIISGIFLIIATKIGVFIKNYNNEVKYISEEKQFNINNSNFSVNS